MVGTPSRPRSSTLLGWNEYSTSSQVTWFGNQNFDCRKDGRLAVEVGAGREPRVPHGGVGLEKWLIVRGT